VSTTTDGPEAIVPKAARRRLSNQVARAYRGTYGARTGLRTLVRAMSVQMLRAGSSPEAIARALSDVALKCPVVVGLPATRNDAVDASALPALISEYSSEVAIEMNHRRAKFAPRRQDTPSPESSR
jgi:hypothetical protein